MADDGDSGEKTEQPTGRRNSQARSEGMIPRSVELSQVLAISTAFLLLEHAAPRIWEKLILLFQWCLTSRYGTRPITLDDLRHNFYALILHGLPDVLLILVLTALVGSLSTLIQTKFNWSPKLFKPNFGRLNPVRGLLRLFTVQNAIQTLKSIFKLAIIAPVAYFGFIQVLPQTLSLMALPTAALLPFTGGAMALVFWRIIKLMAILAILDYLWQLYSVGKKLKMSKTEVKDEQKAIEGDEGTRRRFRVRAMQRLRARMLKAVKTADVVVTNPTHYAVALQYSMERGTAPKVVAKGKNFFAQRIKAVAAASGVPIVEKKELARALYRSVEVDQEIPFELYAAVAELLAYVYRVKGRNPLARRKRPEQEKQPSPRAH